ncbi:hypothetical protein CRENBAI_013945 [Crenichthys baileyi]|uniref:Uncharacterized protein n=1 Tax=Crenichthys baileyi TaxID=28760 RepID=A0AAV9RF10_9TELE
MSGASSYLNSSLHQHNPACQQGSASSSFSLFICQSSCHHSHILSSCSSAVTFRYQCPLSFTSSFFVLCQSFSQQSNSVFTILCIYLKFLSYRNKMPLPWILAKDLQYK